MVTLIDLRLKIENALNSKCGVLFFDGGLKIFPYVFKKSGSVPLYCDISEWSKKYPIVTYKNKCELGKIFAVWSESIMHLTNVVSHVSKDNLLYINGMVRCKVTQSITTISIKYISNIRSVFKTAFGDLVLVYNVRDTSFHLRECMLMHTGRIDNKHPSIRLVNSLMLNGQVYGKRLQFNDTVFDLTYQSYLQMCKFEKCFKPERIRNVFLMNAVFNGERVIASSIELRGHIVGKGSIMVLS